MFQRILLKFSIQNSLLLAILLILSPASIQAREVQFAPVEGIPKTMQEGSVVVGRKGDRIVLDLSQGAVFFIRSSLVDLPILRNDGGGAQTLVRVRGDGSKITARVRKFTNKNSWFKIANFSGSSSVVSRGTEFTVVAIGNDLITGVGQSTIYVKSGGVEAVVATGQSAILKDGQPPIVFETDYLLQVYGLKVDTLFGRENVVTGTIELGNSVEVDNGSVEMSDRVFRAVTALNYVRVVNPSGNERRIYFSGGVKPFFGH